MRGKASPIHPDELPENVRQYFDWDSQRIDGHGDMARMIIERICRACGTKKIVAVKELRSTIKKGNRVQSMCRVCYLKPGPHRKLWDAKHWKGGRRFSRNGYVILYRPEHPRCDKNRCIPEHRIVMERILGRYLESGETVHHKNGIRDDNRPENLELWFVNHPTGVRSKDVKRHCLTCTCFCERG